MKNKNNIICLGVNELFQDKQLHYPATTLPSLCFFEFTQTLQHIIDNAIKLLFEQRLHEVTIQTSNVNWYFNLTDRYHHNIRSLMHVDAMTISFSGSLRPYKQSHFSTAKISINQLKFNQIPISSINLEQLTIPLAKGLINKIQQLSRQYSEQEDLYYGIEPIVNELRALDEKVAFALHIDSESQLSLLNIKGNQIYAKMETLEIEMNYLSEQLLYQVFGLTKGDWLSYKPQNDATLTQLQFEHCRVYDNTLNIIGPGITKAGILGKREQYINIEFGVVE
ncbi:MAG: hypothetical protein MJK12_16715 [Colwellia sp.]|nr:hypothetical protein [Colwellia sp.]